MERYKTLLTAGQPWNLADRAIRLTVMYNAAVALSAVVILSFNVAHLLGGYYLLAAWQIGLLTINILALLPLQRCQGSCLGTNINLMLGSLYLLLLGTLVHGGLDRSAPLWLNLFPVVAMLFAGKERGLRWSLVYLGSYALLFLMHGKGLINLPYQTAYGFVALGSLIAMTGLIYLYERPRSAADKLIADQRIALLEANRRLQEEITEREAAQRALEASHQRLQQLAHHDPLTKLPNRLLFFDRMEQSLLSAKRRTGSLALLFIDLDRFKPINDSLGHEVGDRVLAEVAARLKGALHDNDTVSRYGGDEFTVILNNVADLNEVEQIAENLQEILCQPFHPTAACSCRIGASIGIALYPQDGESAMSLLEKADLAMYQRKEESWRG